jgi:TolB protein
MTRDGFRTALHGRRIRISVLVLVGLFASACTSLISSASSSSPVDPSLHSVYRLVSVSDGSVAPFPAPEGGSWFRFSPGGSDVIFVKDDADGRPQLFRMGADGSDLTQITPDREWASEADEPAWSADGRWIAYSGVVSSGDREIIATQPGGYHPPRAGLSWGVRDAHAPSWSPDGSKIAFVAQGIWILPMAYYNGNSITTSGPPRLIVSAGDSPAWSPGGDQIVFTSGRGSGRRVAIANADGTHVREIADTTSDHPTWSPDGGMIAYDVWSPDGQVAVWLTDLRTGRHRLLLDGASVESWKDEGTLLVSTHPGGS